MKILVTGVAGFIGFHISKSLLLNNKVEIIGLDNINDYYLTQLKEYRLSILYNNDNFKFYKLDLIEKDKLSQILIKEKPDYIIHLAAQAGVRNSIENPHIHIKSNITGFLNILETSRLIKLKHLVFASSSSVYGLNNTPFFSELDNVDKPASIYASSKKSNENMSYVYSHLYKLPITGLRFFTVYGPWGRPDMAYFKFVKNIIQGKPIDVYGFGKMQRDFTYIDDVVWGIKSIIDKPPLVSKKDNGETIPWQIFNIGNNKPVELEKFIKVIETELRKKSKKIYKEMMMGDVVSTAANIDKIRKYSGYNPSTTIEKGIPKFISWYKSYYK